MTEDVVVGLPFYTGADWTMQCSNSIEDSGFKSYEEMRQHHKKIKRDLEAKGFKVIDVQINASEMQEYFDKKGLKNDGKNRSNYISEMLMKISKGNKE